MAILAECPMCRRRQAITHAECGECGEDMDKARRSKRIRYWITYRVRDPRKGKIVQKKECVGNSIEDARTADGKRRTQKKENRTSEIFSFKKETTWTFSELARWWLNLESVKARSDHDRIEYGFNKFNDVFGDTPIRDVKLSNLKNYQARRRKEGQADATTDHETHSAAKAAIKALWLDNELSGDTWKIWQNFKKLISGKKARKQYARTRVLEVEEYCPLYPHLPHHLQALVDMALYTGMRKSELVPVAKNVAKQEIDSETGPSGLTWKQVNHKDKKIVLKDTKTKIARDIPITEEIEAILNRIPRTLGTDHVFIYRGKSFSDIRGGLKKACESAGIPYGKKVEGGFVFGDLRRTAKTFMARAGVEKAYRDAILGHESQDMDRHYLHPDFDKDLRVAMAKYSSWLATQVANVAKSVAKMENSNGKRLA